ncbi:MAG: sulfurtransferase [Anaerolineales bacterium]
MTAYQTILSAEEQAPNLNDPDWVVLDCRFSLQDPQEGWESYLEAHVPGAVYADLDEDLSGKIVPGQTGRHPLPARKDIVETLSSWGIDEKVQVVAYDDRGGGIAARLWWMLRWMGHEKVAVLNGGWSNWIDQGYPVDDTVETRHRREFQPQPKPELAVDVNFVEEIRLDDEFLLLDARDAERYRGEDEPIDPIAGHIPGAISAPYVDNLTNEGMFRPVEELWERFDRLLEGHSAEKSVFYCGSGVTSTHNILAMVHAGFEMPLLYPGSWSEWITDTSRPIE